MGQKLSEEKVIKVSLAIEMGKSYEVFNIKPEYLIVLQKLLSFLDNRSYGEFHVLLHMDGPVHNPTRRIDIRTTDKDRLAI